MTGKKHSPGIFQNANSEQNDGTVKKSRAHVSMTGL